MANNDRIFKPRRGTKSNFSSTGNKANTVLDTGEVFFEVPDEGQGTGRVRIKMGDGITEYSNLPYAIPFTEDEIIIHDGTDDKTITASSSIQSTAIATNLNNAKSGNTLKNIIHNLREAIYKCACDISYLNGSKANTSDAIKNITRSGTTFTATKANGSTFSFTQQDNNTTTGTSYNAGSCPDNTTFATNGSVARAYNSLNSNKAASGHTHGYTSISNRLYIDSVDIGLTARGDGIWQYDVSTWVNGHSGTKIALWAYQLTDNIHFHLFRIGYTIYARHDQGNVSASISVQVCLAGYF